MSSGLRIEGFDGEIRVHRYLVIGKEEDWITRINALEAEALYKGRSVLVIHEPIRSASSVSAQILRRRWDAVFRVRETFDAQMLATYIANAAKPVRILWHGAHEIPRALWQKWDKADISLVGCSRSGEPLGCEWEAIFFPLENTPAFTERVLGMRGSGMKSLASNVSGYLNEIAENGAALVWSSIGEKTIGSLYWYDPSENREKNVITKGEAMNMLEEVSGFLGRANI
jgi:hypothetical protein